MDVRRIDTAMTGASPLMWRTATAFLALFAVCIGMSIVDPRDFQGVNLWLKPAKFFLSLAVHLATVTAALLLIPDKARKQWPVRLAAAVIVSMSLFEVIYISVRAARAEDSHFNTASEFAAVLYTLMGIGAVLIMLGTAAVGGVVLRQGPPTLFARTVGWSFLIAAAATVWSGLAIGSMGSHWIGGDRTDATGLPLLGWSRTGGDLRPAHFIGLHLMQILPLAALTGRRALVITTGLACATGFAAAMALAVSGIPLFPHG